jgi:ApbE superfamily uncharacterized protein (UPF0280 family)
MTLTISVWAENQARPVMAVQTARKALDLLERLSEDQPILKIKPGRIRNFSNISPLVKRALSACKAISPDLTGMATIAGLVADELVAFAFTLGGDRIIVNNGGDIAPGLGKNQTVRVALKDPWKETVAHFLEIRSSHGVGGVATSGWRGRSFSPGVADAVSVWASDCLLADAAATWIAGQMKLNSPKVIQRPAKDLDPETDIPHLMITRDVLALTDGEKETVLAAGHAAAKELMVKGIIRGAFMSVQGICRWMAHNEPFSREYHIK